MPMMMSGGKTTPYDLSVPIRIIISPLSTQAQIAMIWIWLAIGTAVIEVTAVPHAGCAKFVERFGLDAMKWVNSEMGKELHLRGINARVVQAGAIRTGDSVSKSASRG